MRLQSRCGGFETGKDKEIMAKQKQQQPERSVLVTIRSPAKTARFDTWRYWEIVAELQMMHTERADAVEAANWCLRAKPGSSLTVGEIRMEVTDG